MKNSWVAKVGLFAGLLFLLSGPAGAQDIKIGVIQPLSGPMALLGKYSLEGSEVARLELNGKGGLLGKKVEFIIVDAPDAKGAAAAAEKLCTVDKVKIIMGTYSSSLSYAAPNVADKYGVVYWELGAISDDITARGFKYVFRTCPAASIYSYSALQCMSEYLAPKLGKKADQLKLGLVFEDSLFGTGCRDMHDLPSQSRHTEPRRVNDSVRRGRPPGRRPLHHLPQGKGSGARFSSRFPDPQGR